MIDSLSLDPEVKKAIAKYAAKLKDPSEEQLRALQIYGYMMAQAGNHRKDPEKARVFKGAALYSRNRTGLFPYVFVDRLDLLLDEGQAGVNVTDLLDPSWQIDRPGSYMTDPQPY